MVPSWTTEIKVKILTTEDTEDIHGSFAHETNSGWKCIFYPHLLSVFIRANPWQRSSRVDRHPIYAVRRV